MKLLLIRVNRGFIMNSFLVLLLLFMEGKAQSMKVYSSLEGKIIEKDSGLPLQAVNIYISGTAIGTTSDSTGHFLLKNIPVMNAEVVFSMIGYVTQIRNFNFNESRNKKADIVLVKTAYELKNITVVAEIPEDWKNQLAEFKKLFFGEKKFAADCRIINETYLDFSETPEIFTAKSPVPLEIINPALGYSIEVYLQTFKYFKLRKQLQYKVCPYFKEMPESETYSQSEISENRAKTFNGSLKVLLMSLAQGSFDFSDEGFEVTYMHGERPLGLLVSAEEIVIKGIGPDQFILNPVQGSITRFGYECYGLKVRYTTSEKDETSYIIARNENGALFNSAGIFEFTEDHILMGDFAKYGFADELPSEFSTDSFIEK